MSIVKHRLIVRFLAARSFAIKPLFEHLHTVLKSQPRNGEH